MTIGAVRFARFLALLAGAAFCVAAAEDPWTPQEIVPASALAARLQADGAKPLVFFVGFPTLYRNGAHVLGAKLAGPCSKAEGLEELKKAVANLPHDAEIFIYCGCCPFVKCPNIRPAYAALHDLGYRNIKVVMLETNLHSDWIEKGYPVERAAPPPQ